MTKGARMFQCAGCGHVFAANNTVEQRDAEAAALYRPHDDETVSLCDGCYAIAVAALREREGHDPPFDDPVIVRASSTDGYLDCGRRTAADVFEPYLSAAGYDLRRKTTHIGAHAGSAVHAGTAHLCEEKAKGAAMSLPAATDAAVETLRKSVGVGAIWDRETPNLNTGERQVTRMLHSYATNLLPTLHPILVEQRLEVQVTPLLILSGQEDLIAREPGAVRDTKTGKVERVHQGQLGCYSVLGRAHGYPVERLFIDFIPRVQLKDPQPAPTSTPYQPAQAERTALVTIRRMDADLRAFRFGDEERRIEPGDPHAFPANPNSYLCGAAYCRAHGSAFCREHKRERE